MYYSLINSMKRADGFSPTSLSGLNLWLDASDFTTAGAISQWNDKSGLNNHLLQATGVSQPSVVLAQKNSKAIVRFNVLSFMSLTSSILSSTDRTDFFLVKKDASDRACSLSDNGNVYATLLNGSSFYTQMVNYFQEGLSIGTVNYDVFMHTRTGSTMVLYKNNVVISSSRFGNTYPNNNYTIFGRHSAGIPSICDVAEHIYYNRVLTSQERLDIQTYLTTKWAL